MQKHSMPQIIVASLLSLVVGVAAPWLWPLAMTYVVYCMPLLLCFVAAWAGPIPGSVMAAALVIRCFMVGGIAMAAGAAVLVIVPAAVNVWTLHKRLPFFRALKVAIAAQLVCTLAVAVGLYLYTRQDLVDLVTLHLRRLADTLNITAQNQLVRSMAQLGVVSESYRTLNAFFLTGSQRAILFDQVAALLNESLRLTLPGTALCGSVVGALLTVTLPRYWCARRGVEPQVQYVPLTQWRVPLDVAAGVSLCLIAAQAAARLGVVPALGASGTMLALLLLVLEIHGGAALMRMLKQNGVRHGMRMLLLLVGLMPGMYILYLGGAYSLIFGSHGAVPVIRKRMRNREGDDG